MITIFKVACHVALRLLYTFQTWQAGPEEAMQWTGSLLQFKLAAVKLAVCTCISHSGRETLCDVICPTMEGRLFTAIRMMTIKTFMAGNIRGISYQG
jgi:hypothetical protein